MKSRYETYGRQLGGCKNDVLQRICISCGLSTGKRKQETVESIVRGLTVQSGLPSRVLVLAIDIGLKNFSYCKAEEIKQGQKMMLKAENWSRMDLHERYGEGYDSKHEGGTAGDSKRYLSYLAYRTVEELVVRCGFSPTVIAVESQRTRSNNNSATLPNVLLNYTFESMLYACFFGFQQSHAGLRNTIIQPMNSNRMANFWINRFVPVSLKDSKKMRKELLFYWLGCGRAPFEHTLELPADFRGLSSAKKARVLQALLDLSPNSNKMDDLVDSLLYALMTYKLIDNRSKLKHALDSNKDMASFVQDIEGEHYEMIKGIINRDIKTK